MPTERPSNYRIDNKATFDNVSGGHWIVSKSQPDRLLEVVSKKGDNINLWDWEPWKLIQNFIMSKDEFNHRDYHHIIEL